MSQDSTSSPTDEAADGAADGTPEPHPQDAPPEAAAPDPEAAEVAGTAAATPPPERNRRLAIIVAAAAGVVILAVIGAVVVASWLGDDLPEAGDCMSNDADPTEIRVVDCGSEEAAWTVVGVDGTWTEQEFADAARDRVCQAIPKWDNALWLGEETDDGTGEGTVVCLRATSPE